GVGPLGAVANVEGRGLDRLGGLGDVRRAGHDGVAAAVVRVLAAPVGRAGRGPLAADRGSGGDRVSDLGADAGDPRRVSSPLGKGAGYPETLVTLATRSAAICGVDCEKPVNGPGGRLRPRPGSHLPFRAGCPTRPYRRRTPPATSRTARPRARPPSGSPSWTETAASSRC